MDELSEKARLIQKAANQLGWTSDIQSLTERVKQIDKGLIHEDEFLYILDWSKRCNFFHKLDQSIVPSGSKKKYTIPDVLVEFKNNGKKKPFLIEIKTSKAKKLSWTETYYNGLIRYSNLLGIPILIAWKWSSFDIWTLFEIKHFKKGPSNYKIDFEKAHKENLMSSLAGDYVIIPHEEFSITFKFEKSQMVAEKGTEKIWDTLCKEIYFTGKEFKKIEEVDDGIFALLMSLDCEQETKEDENFITTRFFPYPNNTTFAQSIPIRLAKTISSNPVNWLEKIRNNKYPISYAKLWKSLEKGIPKELIQTILLLTPHSEIDS